LIIAHRWITVQCADRVLMLHRGELIEQGTHAELLARNGIDKIADPAGVSAQRVKGNHEVRRDLAESYRWLTGLSASLMLLGWLWHLWRHDSGNWVIGVGIGLLLLTPLLTLLQLACSTARTDKRTALYSLLTVVLVGIALVVGLWMSPSLGGR
jgi:hypothetical protein